MAVGEIVIHQTKNHFSMDAWKFIKNLFQVSKKKDKRKNIEKNMLLRLFRRK